MSYLCGEAVRLFPKSESAAARCQVLLITVLEIREGRSEKSKQVGKQDIKRTLFVNECGT